MTLFLVLTVGLTLLAVGWLLVPLLSRLAPDGASSQQLNAAIYRDQLDALDRDLATGALRPSEHEVATDELQLRLLDDTDPAEPLTEASTAGAPNSAPVHERRTALVLALFVPSFAVAMYLWLGQPDAVVPTVVPEPNSAQIESMVATLAARLKDKPNDPKGWAMLARSYKVTGRLDEAEKAYLNTGSLLRTNPDLMVDFAELLAVRAGNRMAGQPLELVAQALVLDPVHPSALMMSGVAAYQVADYESAVRQWEALLAVLEPGSVDAEMTQTNLDDAREKAQAAKRAAAKP